MKKIHVFMLVFLLGCATATHSAVAGLKNTMKGNFSTGEVENQINLDREANPLYESKLFTPIHQWDIGGSGDVQL